MKTRSDVRSVVRYYWHRHLNWVQKWKETYGAGRVAPPWGGERSTTYQHGWVLRVGRYGQVPSSALWAGCR